MNKSCKILSDIIVHMKYARYLPNKQRRETWEEIVIRNMNMHIRKYPELEESIRYTYDNFVFTKKVLPSMRSLQFGGRPIELSPNRMFNCAYMPVDHPYAFSETMFLLLGGTGVGFSVQHHHVDKLPIVRGPITDRRRFVIGDSIEGWADAVKVLVKSYFNGSEAVDFDFSDIRSKGTELVTSGGKAPGPQPLEECLGNVKRVLDNAVGKHLTTLQAYDIQCHIADAVLAGGIRRAALIALFDLDDKEMFLSKVDKWYELNPQRGRSNNSAVILRHKITKDVWDKCWETITKANTGEPGVYFSNDKDWGVNPCCEIGLRPFQMCNLTEVNVSDVESQHELNLRVAAASFLGTLQAGYTDFHYLRHEWKEACERDALIGVSLTGIGSGKILALDLEEAAEHVKFTNARTAEAIGINEASRTTTVKPAGTSSLVLGCSSGIHAWFNDFYLRRVGVSKDEAVYKYLAKNHPQLVEDDYFRPETQAKIEVPIAAPEGSILRTENALELLERVRKFNVEWVRAGHRKGENTHNVSCTISVKPDEWKDVGEWMWKNRAIFNGIAVLPYDGGTYPQAPFEDITEEKFNMLFKTLNEIDLNDVIEEEDNTDLKGEVACSGGACEIA